MQTFWTVSIVLLFLLMAGAYALLLGLSRELGVILSRTPPTSARSIQAGPQVGDALAPISLDLVSGKTYEMAVTKNIRRLLVFVSPACPACSALVPHIDTFRRAYRGFVDVIVIASHADNKPEQLQMQQSVLWAVSANLHSEFGITATPYALLVDPDLHVEAAGIVNTLGHLESLLAIDVYQDTRRQSVDGGGLRPVEPHPEDGIAT